MNCVQKYCSYIIKKKLQEAQTQTDRLKVTLVSLASCLCEVLFFCWKDFWTSVMKLHGDDACGIF